MKNEAKKMRKLYDQWQTQGISKQAFCNQNGIGYHKFNYWVKKFKSEERIGILPVSGFSQIPSNEPDLAPDEKQAHAVITFPSGARLELSGFLDSSLIRELVR